MLLDERSAKILQELIENESMTVTEMAKKLSLSRRTVYYSIEDIESWLNVHKLAPLDSVRGRGYFLKDKDLVKSKLAKATVFPDFTIKERQSLIICALLLGEQKISVEDLVELTLVSRNTIFTDFKTIRDIFSRYNLELTYDQNLGYLVKGSEIQKRSLFLFSFYPLHELVFNARIPEHLKYRFLNRTQIVYVYTKLKKIEQDLNLEYVEGTLLSLATLLNSVLHGRKEVESLNLIEEEIENHQEYISLKSHFDTLSKIELEYFALHLLSTRTQIATVRDKRKEDYELAQAMISKFEQLAAITFSKRSLLVKQISNHLSLSYYRYRYGIHHANPLLDEIKEKYYDEFVITDKVCDILRNKYKTPVGDGEVAYITLYFASFLVRENYSADNYIIHIVCPSGVSTSMMLKTELEYLHPKIKIDKLMSVNEFKKSNIAKGETIVSTVNLDTDLKYIKVNPLLSAKDKRKILEALPVNLNTCKCPDMQDIVSVLKPYVSADDLEVIKSDLNRLFMASDSRSIGQEVRVVNLLTPDNVRIVKSVENLKEAIGLATLPLVEKSIVKEEYIEAIIKATNKFGPYMVIEGGYMLAHASYNDGVNDLGLSFLKIEEPVSVKGEVVDKIFCLAPIDQKQHLGIIRELSSIFTNSNIIKTINKSSKSIDIYQAIIDFLLDQ